MNYPTARPDGGVAVAVGIIVHLKKNNNPFIEPSWLLYVLTYRSTAARATQSEAGQRLDSAQPLQGRNLEQ